MLRVISLSFIVLPELSNISSSLASLEEILNSVLKFPISAFRRQLPSLATSDDAVMLIRAESSS